MFKTVSAALLVASIFAAPAMAAGIAKTDVAPVTKSEAVAPKALNAKTRIRTAHIHHRFHRHFASAKTHKLTHRVAHVGKTKPDLKRVSAIKTAPAKKG